MDQTPASTAPQARDDAEEMMAAYGIVRVPADYFHWSGYRYTSLKDAVAAARRAAPGGTAGV